MKQRKEDERTGIKVEDNKSRKRRRRPRRKVQPSTNNIITTPPLSKKKKVALHIMCQQLHTSLSLPNATVLVHIRLLKKGVLHPGMQIVSPPTTRSMNTTPSVTGTGTSSNHNRAVASSTVPFLSLGTITAGSFSTSRGVYHGIGIIGASRLLEYLTTHVTATTTTGTGTTTSYGRVVRLANGSQSFQLLVHVLKKNDNTMYNKNNDNKKRKRNQQKQEQKKKELEQQFTTTIPTTRTTGESSCHTTNDNYKYYEACISLLI